MESIIETFHIDWKIIVAQAINFAIVFVVLYIFALKPLNKIMAERAEKIAKGLSDAKSNALLVKDTTVKYEEALAQAKIEANSLFQEAKKEAEQKKALMLEDAKTQVENMIQSGKAALEVEKIKMVGEAKKEIVSLTMFATEKLLGSKAGDFDQKIIKELDNI